MANQSWKQQMYQSIANSQVQQVMQQQRDQGIAQLQAEFDAWQKQQNDIAQLQAEYDNWYAQNNPQPAQPVQTAPVETAQATQEIPSIKTVKPKRDLQAEAQEYFAKVRAQREQEAIEKRNNVINGTLNMLNTSEFKDMAKKGKAQSVIENREQQKKAEAEAIEKQIAGLNTYNTDNLPQLTDDQKALEEQILNADRYVPNNPNKEKWNERFLTAQEKSDAINKTTPEDVTRWLSPETKLTQKEKGIARTYAAAELAKIPTHGSTHQPLVKTEEEKQHYNDMVAIMNKTNPISSAATGFVDLPYNLIDMIGDAGRSVGNQLGGLGAAITDKLGITEGATQRHNEKAEAANEFADTTDANFRKSIANAQTQYPGAYAGGKIAGQVTMYALTNPVFDGIAEGAGVTNELAKFFINQGAQNAQDLALDTAPLVRQLMADGSLSDEDKREVFNNVLLNALGNAAMGTVQEIPNIAKYAGEKIDAKNAADEAFRQNVLAGKDTLAKLANAEDVDNVVRNATRQAEEATQNIKNIAKQMPEIPENISPEVNPDDVVYHSGTLSRLNKAETRGKMSEGSRNTGYYGTGHYFVDGQHKVELDNNSTYSKKPYSSVDISKYNNLYRAATDEQASDLHDFSQKYTRYVNGYNDRYFTNAEGVDEVSKAEYLDDLYNQFRRLFPEQNTSKESFVNKLEAFRKGEKDIDLMNRDDSVFTQFMKDMGYNGVDTRGTRSADTSRGVVIYDLDENSILQSNVDAAEAKQGLMNTRIREGNKPLFDIEEDKRIQKILDDQKNKAAIVDEYHRLYDDTALQEAQRNYEDLYSQVNNLEENARPYFSRLLEDEAYLNADVRDQIKEFERFGLIEDFDTLKAQKLADAQKSLAEIDERITSLKQQLADAQNILDEQDKLSQAAYKQAKEAINNPTAKAIEQPKTNAVDIPEEAQEQILSDFEEIYRSMDNMDRAANATGNAKVIEKFNKLQKSVFDYEEKVWNAETLEEVNKAKKAADAARQSFIREMKKIDPNYTGDLTGTKLGQAIYRRGNPKLSDADTQAMIDDWVKQDVENPNRFVKDAEPDSTNVYRGVEDSNIPNNENDLWEQLKAGENNPVPNDRTQIPMNIQALGEEPSSRAEKILQEIRNGEDVPNGPQPKVSEFYNNSMQRNKYAWDAEDLNDLYTADRFEYLPTSEKTSVQNAFENVKANRDNLIDRYSRQADSITKPKEMKQFYNSQDIDQMHLLIRDLRRKEALAKDPAQKALFAQQRYDITKHLYDATHSSAAVMQAGQKWLNDADGILDTAESYRIKKANEVFENNPKLKQEADRVAEDIYNRFKELEKNNVLVDLSEEERKKRLREMIDEALSNSEVKRRLGQEDIEKIANNLLQTPTADRIKQGIEDALSNIGWIKDETVQEVYDIWSRIEDLDPGSKQFQKEVTKIYSLLANDIGGSGTFWDKVDSWRYLAMLANPTTHIRNILGNVTMNWMTGIKNNLAAGIEAVADRASKNGIQGGRTKAILTLKDGDLVKQSGKYFDNHAYGEFLQGGTRYTSASTGIDDAIPTFKTKALDKAAKGHSNLLSAEDVNFGRAKYKTSLAGFLKANGADASIFNATDAASRELLERAHRYALDAANEATFHTENAAANALSQFTKNLKASDNVLNKSLGVMIDTTVPFKKTPMNILKNCFEYSPVEFAKVIVDIGNWKKGKIATSTMIDNLSKAITGTGGMAIGALLAHEGIIKVTNGTNKEQSYDKLTGQQALALNVLGHNIDISFLPPAVMPFIMGATLLNDYKQKYGDDYTALDILTSSLTDPELAANTALESLDTIVDTTMLSGINDLINTIRYAEEPQDVIKSLAAKTATNYAGQMIPTLAKKTASVVDGQKYSSYSDKTGAAKTLDSSLKYLKTTIPGLQAAGKAMEGSSNKTIAKIGDAITAEPKINGWGNTEKKEDYGIGIGGRAIDQYLNPATTTKVSEDRTTNEIKALANRVNDDSVLDIGNISTAESKFSLDNKQYKLNEKQWTTYSRIEGHTAKDLADSYVRSKQWNNDTDQDRADTIKKMKAFSKAYAQSKVTGAEMSSSNKELAKIYKEDGAKGLMEEFHRQTVFSKYEVSKSDGANAVYQDLGEGGVEKYANFKKKLGDSSKSEDVEKLLNSSGMSKSDKAKYYSYLKPSATPGNNPYGYIPGVSYDPEKDESYQKAVKAIPSLKPEKYYETKDTIDADKNGTLKQDELINYINSKAKNDAEAQKMWAAYGGWTNKNGDIKKLVGSPGHYTSSY